MENLGEMDIPPINVGIISKDSCICLLEKNTLGLFINQPSLWGPKKNPMYLYIYKNIVLPIDVR